MKFLVLFLLLAGSAWGTKIASFPLNGNGSCVSCQPGITDMQAVGSPAFSTITSKVGTLSFGKGTDANYFRNDSLQAALTTTASSYTFDFDVLWTIASGYHIAISTEIAARSVIYFNQGDNLVTWVGNSSAGVVLSTITYTAGIWRHVTLNWNGTTPHMFVDGVDRTNYDVTGGMAWSGTQFWLGRYPPAGNPFDGYIQNLEIYDTATTPTPAGTATNTPTITPTPMCLAKFTPYAGNPVLVPTQTWEANAVAEPAVIVDGNTLRMAHFGGWMNAGGGLATASISNPFVWTSVPGPIVGEGSGGEAGYAVRNTIYKVSANDYRWYYDDGDIRRMNSGDGSAWTLSATIVVAHNAHPPATEWENSSFIPDSITAGVWWGTICGYAAAWGGSGYRDSLFKSTDDGVTFQWVADLPSLQVGTGMYGGGCLRSGLGDGLYHKWYHYGPAGLADTRIRHAVSANLLDWYPDSCDTLTVTGNSQGLASPDQVADPNVVQISGKSYLYFSTMDSVNAGGRIGAAVYNGSLHQLVTGVNDTPTPTPVPSTSSSLYLSKQLKLRE